MKNITFILSLCIVTLLLSYTRRTADLDQVINPLLGDISFLKKFGVHPTTRTNEDLRIKTHFEYVENILRQRDISKLTPELQKKREHILDLLHQYWTAGVFPRNYEYADKRVPCFIDKEGRICGVGYLVERTVGRQVAKEINRNHKYDKLLEMNDKTIDCWVSSSGLTKEECAMIQPTYGPTPTYNYNYISPRYGISSAVLGGVNLSLNTMNAIQISGRSKDKAIPVISLFTGAGAIILGAVNIPNERYFAYSNTNESKKHLSLLNIGFGTTTMILGICNLVVNKPKKDKSVAWNFYSFRGQNNQAGLALCWTKKL